MKKPHPILIIVLVLAFVGQFVPEVLHHARWYIFKKDFATALPTVRAELVSKNHQIVSRELSRLTRAQITAVLGKPSSSSDTILNYEWPYPDGDSCKIELTFAPDNTVRGSKYQWKQ